MTMEELREANTLSHEIRELESARDRVLKVLKALELDKYSGPRTKLEIENISCSLDSNRTIDFLMTEVGLIDLELQEVNAKFRNM